MIPLDTPEIDSVESSSNIPRYIIYLTTFVRWSNRLVSFSTGLKNFQYFPSLRGHIVGNQIIEILSGLSDLVISKIYLCFYVCCYYRKTNGYSFEFKGSVRTKIDPLIFLVHSKEEKILRIVVKKLSSNFASDPRTISF